MSKDAPSNASELVGERDGEDVVMQPLLGRLEPRLEPVTIPALRLDQYNPCGLNEQNAQVAIAALRYLAEDGAVAGRDLLGESPSQAAKSRPFVNASPVPIAATIALEMIGPIPGTLIKRSQPASRRAGNSISIDTQASMPIRHDRRFASRFSTCPRDPSAAARLQRVSRSPRCETSSCRYRYQSRRSQN